MLSVANLLIALVAVVGDGFQAMAGACGPPNQCYQSLSKDPIGAEPWFDEHDPRNAYGYRNCNDPNTDVGWRNGS